MGSAGARRLPAALELSDSTQGPGASMPGLSAWRGHGRRRSLTIAAVALTGSGVVLWAVAAAGPPFAKGSPDYSSPHLIRAGVMALAAVILVLWLERGADRRPRLESGWQAPPSSHGAATYLLLPLAVATAAVALLISDAHAFFSQAREDAAVETAQVGLLLVAAALFARRSVRGLRHPSAAGRASLLPGLAALALLVVALEEISWGQRLLDFEAGTSFSSNQQGETNLHNFSTHEFEAVYYSGLFAALVLLPYLRDRSALPTRFRGLADFAPGLYVLFAAAPMVAFNYGEWNQPLVQFAVFVTAAILAAYVVEAVRLRRRPWAVIAPGLALAGLVSIQLALLIEGDSMLRWWHNTEYKELLGTLVLLLWAIEIARRPPGGDGILTSLGLADQSRRQEPPRGGGSG